jgi:hypothetical protein
MGCLPEQPRTALPARSKARLLELESEHGDRLSARDLADIAAADSFLCLRLLREAEGHRVQRLGHETTTPLGAVMQLGTDSFHKLLLSCPETDETNAGLAECEARSYLASRLALRWGTARADISPDEIAMAALLSEIGELLLWSFALTCRITRWRRCIPAIRALNTGAGRHLRLPFQGSDPQMRHDLAPAAAAHPIHPRYRQCPRQFVTPVCRHRTPHSC